ncbi:TetR family transcriptional regulator [Pseudomonas sp. GL93]|uniref:TetR/AcrR family transcriptional regulator n=1 Tax=Pseudomonas sp. GL93 TaxID=2014741 RepID=UPI000E3226BF|nr:TetR/AcrR family transcriptional regulator [Pseudomonas sp. GL93]RFD32545.1 TetR family transcriptional regulator [Pseudomonas sp. GL93]
MRYSAEHKEDTRRRIVEAAGATAKKHGFGTTGVDGLMGAAGLKGSSFYHHFASKQDLLGEVIQAELEGSRERFACKPDASKQDALKQALAYMSVRHIESPEEGCVLPSLSAEVARSSDEVKKIYEDSIKSIQREINKAVDDGNTTWALLAMSIGAVTMARAMSSDRSRDEVLKACRLSAKRMFEALEDQ